MSKHIAEYHALHDRVWRSYLTWEEIASFIVSHSGEIIIEQRIGGVVNHAWLITDNKVPDYFLH